MARNRRNSLTRVRRIIAQQGSPQAPSVNAIEPEVRTDSSYPVTDGTDVKDLSDRVKEGAALGAYVVEWGYDVPEDKWRAFHQWLNANELKLAQSAPKGVHYKGTVVTVFGPHQRPDGHYRTFWALSSIDSVENFWTQSSGPFKTLVKGLLEFGDRRSGAGFSQLYQIAAGAPVY